MKIENSSLWSAYGDALGFITELANEKVLKARIGTAEVSALRSWTRKIGGMAGGFVDFPAGVYSDDTQLRLAVSRAISATGYFDVEAFAKIELAVWQSYCLGAGRGSKVASENICKASVDWFSNFYDVKGASYFNSGGNGAVMRIQPHVWSSGQKSLTSILLDVCKNTICTHGHPRAFVGSCFHASFLYYVLREERIPSVESWFDIVDEIKIVPELLQSDYQLQTAWLPYWEGFIDASFSEKYQDAVDELTNTIVQLIELDDIGKSEKEKYKYVVKMLGGLTDAERGSALKTSVFASYLSYLYPSNPSEAMIVAANTLDSDTDSIATMCGAILGLVVDERPPEVVLDDEYIKFEAARMYEISEALPVQSFNYPALGAWAPPRNKSDSLRLSKSGAHYVAGLGEVIFTGRSAVRGKNKSLRWEWVVTKFGQTLLIRSKDKLVDQGDDYRSVGYITEMQAPLMNGVENETSNEISIKDRIARLANAGYSEAQIGMDIVELSKLGVIENVVAYAAIVGEKLHPGVKK
ncbi:MAG: ADP-ribosylglycohydrolase family protein [Flavobacteriaceae bacterium]